MFFACIITQVDIHVLYLHEFFVKVEIFQIEIIVATCSRAIKNFQKNLTNHFVQFRFHHANGKEFFKDQKFLL
jgi:hypothetical protein